ncbi:hypothetical protein ACQEVM_34080 [Streptomyces sp. CA-243310]|uniref:hypothetical protein n=1 Tax=Streptomyces sp. CA-243310 TaxID=3240056 RepID=UPI003D8E7B77
MDPVELACAVGPVTALLYGLFGARIRQERVSHRGHRSLTTAGAVPLPGAGGRLPDGPFAAVVWAGSTVFVATTTEPASRNPGRAARLRVGRIRTRRGRHQDRYRDRPRSRPRLRPMGGA